MSELNGGIPIEVNPTIELHARVEMGGTASEYNAEAWAVGERGGVPVSSTDQTYHNNSKYYAEQAAEDVQEVNNASAKIDNMTVEGNTGAPGSSVAVAITEVSGHKHIAFTIPQGAKGETGSPGKDFHIAFTFASIAAMIAYSGDIDLFDYAMIDTGNVQDADTGKLYCYEQDEEWHYIGDLSGAQGIKGETGTGISSIVLNQDYTLTINLDNGTYYTTTSIRGAKGDIGDTGTGIVSAVLNQDYTLTINFDDGTSYTTPNSIRGVTGATPNIVIGTVSTLLPGQQAYVTLDPSSTAERPVLNIGIPKGDTGTMENTYGSTIEMTPSDSTKISTAIGGKADKVSGATNGNFAGLDANGNLTDSGHKHSDYLTQHQDISGKADKVSGATNGNFAGLDANGNLTDSGSKASDFVDADDFNATEMPMAATDDTTVADVINWNPDVMLDAILGITNVRDAKIFWNRAGSAAGNVGAGKLAVLVESGSAQSIAEAIHTYNTTGLETEGTVSKTVEGDTVYFSRPTAKTVSFSIALKGYTAPDLTTLGPAIQSAVMAYVNGMTIGEDLDCQKLHNVIKQAAGSSAGSFEIADLSCSGTHGVSRGIIPAGWNGIFKVAASTDVTVTASATEESQAIANIGTNPSIGSYNSLASLISALDTLLSSIASGGIKTFSFTVSGTIAPFSNGVIYFGTIYKYGPDNSYCHANFRQVGNLSEIIGSRNPNGWEFVKNRTQQPIYYDFETTLTSQTGYSVSITVGRSGYRLIGATFIYNDDLYHLMNTDNKRINLAIRSDTQVNLTGMGTSLATSTDRTIKVRAIYLEDW